MKKTSFILCIIGILIGLASYVFTGNFGLCGILLFVFAVLGASAGVIINEMKSDGKSAKEIAIFFTKAAAVIASAIVVCIIAISVISSNTFTNEYGTPKTKCVKVDCENVIARSGDTNCCVKHSNKCSNCKKYIDSDAMYCMECLSGAINDAIKSKGN